MLKHGSDKELYFLVMISVSDEEAAEWSKTLKAKPTVISMGKLKLTPLQLEAKAEIGSVDSKLYDPETGSWTSTAGLMRFK